MQCPQHKKALTKLAVSDASKRCDMCGRAAQLYCVSCKFLLCSQCRICDNRHFLVKMLELEKVKAEYYSNNYVCSTCKKDKIGNDDGLWHCNECDFDLCPECLD